MVVLIPWYVWFHMQVKSFTSLGPGLLLPWHHVNDFVAAIFFSELAGIVICYACFSAFFVFAVVLFASRPVAIFVASVSSWLLTSRRSQLPLFVRFFPSFGLSRLIAFWREASINGRRIAATHWCFAQCARRFVP